MSTSLPDTPITRFSIFFSRRARLTILLTLIVLGFGFISYTRLLNREGFPPVQVPIVFIQATYFINDASRVNDEITVPIESTISPLEEIKEIRSTTPSNGAFFVLELESDTELKAG